MRSTHGCAQRYIKDAAGELWWCIHHTRRAEYLFDRGGKIEHVCDPHLAGIMLPCKTAPVFWLEAEHITPGFPMTWLHKGAPAELLASAVSREVDGGTWVAVGLRLHTSSGGVVEVWMKPDGKLPVGFVRHEHQPGAA